MLKQSSIVRKMTDTIYQFSYKALNPDIKIDPNTDFKGKVVLIESVDSNWGFTKGNYKDLNQLHNKYHASGLVIVTQPCNQFPTPLLGTEREPENGTCLLNSITKKFKPEWKFILDKADVKGPNAHPLFNFLKTHPNCQANDPWWIGGKKDEINWNFTKFLIDRKGVPRSRFSPNVNPMAMEEDIKKLLDESA